MTVGVCGSRGYEGAGHVGRLLQLLLDGGYLTRVVSGGARGPDTYAENWARLNKVPLTVHKPDWDKHGKSAGYIRNVDIVHDSDLLLAFYDGSSKGTRHTMNLAKQKGIKVYVIDPEGEVIKW
jgi:hypothetical protein